MKIRLVPFALFLLVPLASCQPLNGADPLDAGGVVAGNVTLVPGDFEDIAEVRHQEGFLESAEPETGTSSFRGSAGINTRADF